MVVVPGHGLGTTICRVNPGKIGMDAYDRHASCLLTSLARRYQGLRGLSRQEPWCGIACAESKEDPLHVPVAKLLS